MTDVSVAIGVFVAVASTVFATSYGLLPERIDLSVVFAAYGAGAIIGELLGTLPGRDARVLSRRWGALLMSVTAALLMIGWSAD